MSVVLILFFGLMFVGMPIGVTLGVAGVINEIAELERSAMVEIQEYCNREKS